MKAARPIAEFEGVDRVRFEAEIVPRGEPAVLRGLVAHWPAVRQAAEGDLSLARWLAAMDEGREVDALMVPPGRRGRVFFAEGWQQGDAGFNYLRNRLPISQVLDSLLRYARFDRAPAMAAQSAPADDCLPAFRAAHPMPLLDASVAPRLWIGNAIVTPAHFDESSNIACVAAGARRFTLFPPEQIDHLYPGPIGHAPTTTPISVVDLLAGDEAAELARYPRFAQALAAAQDALLEPGDAIYIPPLWWHHVASTAPLNLLVNYWWSASAAPSGLGALLHARLAFGGMPIEQRRAWATFFAHWVFEADEATLAHLPAALHGVHGELTPALREQLRRLAGLEPGDEGKGRP